MRVNFNVLNQKGAPALYEDSLANRPPASFAGRLFVDTDQPTSTGIYRDTGTNWQQIAGGGGGGVNIYNSDGTLTANRTLIGANNDLNFADLNIFKTSVGGNDIGLKLDFANSYYSLGDPNGIITDKFLQIDQFNNRIALGGNAGGINFDYTNNIFSFGDIFNFSNNTIFLIDNNNQIIKTSNQNNDIGLKLDFANKEYSLGEFTTNNRTNFSINDTNQTILTFNQNNNIGLELTFTNNNRRFLFGDFAINYTFLQVYSNPLRNEISFYSNGLSVNGVYCDFLNKYYYFGDLQNNGGYIKWQAFNIELNYNTTLKIVGTSVITGTSGSVSGQHLKVTINGVNYVIELKNP